MKWLRYLCCLLAGAALIHVVPHLLNGLTPRNLLGVCVSLLVGGLLLWAARFSFRDVLAVTLLLIGMAAVLAYAEFSSGRHAKVVHSRGQPVPNLSYSA